MEIPKQYNRIMPYLIVQGSSNFRKFMTDVFSAEEQLAVPTADGNNILHGELKIGESVIMYANATDQFAVQNAGLFIYVDDADATYKRALECGAQAIPGEEPADQEYGRTCGVIDNFGNTWWITSEG